MGRPPGPTLATRAAPMIVPGGWEAPTLPATPRRAGVAATPPSTPQADAPSPLVAAPTEERPRERTDQVVAESPTVAPQRVAVTVELPPAPPSTVPVVEPELDQRTLVELTPASPRIATARADDSEPPAQPPSPERRPAPDAQGPTPRRAAAERIVSPAARPTVQATHPTEPELESRKRPQQPQPPAPVATNEAPAMPEAPPLSPTPQLLPRRVPPAPLSTAAPTANGRAPTTPQVEVRIGRVEVRAPRAPESARWDAPAPALPSSSERPFASLAAARRYIDRSWR